MLLLLLVAVVAVLTAAALDVEASPVGQSTGRLREPGRAEVTAAISLVS